MSFRIISGGFELLSMVDKIADSGLVGEGIVLVVLEQAQVRFEQRAKFSVVDDYFLFKNIPQSSLVLHVVILIYRLVSGEQRCGLFAQVVEGTERLSENAINFCVTNRLPFPHFICRESGVFVEIRMAVWTDENKVVERVLCAFAIWDDMGSFSNVSIADE